MEGDRREVRIDGRFVLLRIDGMFREEIRGGDILKVGREFFFKKNN